MRTFAVIVLFSVSSVMAAQDTASSIRNYLRINTDFCTGGQPKMDEICGHAPPLGDVLQKSPRHPGYRYNDAATEGNETPYDRFFIERWTPTREPCPRQQVTRARAA